MTNRVIGPWLFCLCLCLGTLAPARTRAHHGTWPLAWSHPWWPAEQLSLSSWPSALQSGWEEARQIWFERFHETHQLHEDGRRTRAYDIVLRVRDPRLLPDELPLATLSPARQSTLIEWEARFEGEELGLSARVLRGQESVAGYITGNQQLLIRCPQGQPGSLRVRFTIEEQADPAVPGLFAGQIPVHLGLDIEERRVRLRVPEGRRLYIEQQHFDDRPEESEGSYGVQWTIPMGNLLALHLPPSTHGGDSAAPLLRWSTASWVDLGVALRTAWEERIATPSEPDLQLSDAERIARARAIHDEVADGWAYLGFFPGESGWQPHTRDEIERARLGDCKDQTALMVARMREAGLSAWPALIHAGAPTALPAYGDPGAFNHAIVALEMADEWLFFDSVDGSLEGRGTERPGWSLRPELSDREALILSRVPRLVRTPLLEPALHEDTHRIELRASGPSRVRIEERWQDSAASALRAARRRTRPADWRAGLEARYRALYPGARVISVEEGPNEGPNEEHGSGDEGHWRRSVELQWPAALVGPSPGLLRLNWLTAPPASPWPAGRLAPIWQPARARRTTVQLLGDGRIRLPEDGCEDALEVPRSALAVRCDAIPGGVELVQELSREAGGRSAEQANAVDAVMRRFQNRDWWVEWSEADARAGEEAGPEEASPEEAGPEEASPEADVEAGSGSAEASEPPRSRIHQRVELTDAGVVLRERLRQVLGRDAEAWALGRRIDGGPCRPARLVEARVVLPEGEVRSHDPADLVRRPLGVDPRGEEADPRLLLFPRYGAQPGAVLEEEWEHLFPAECLEIASSQDRPTASLVAARIPLLVAGSDHIEHSLEVVCPAGCVAQLEGAGSAELVETDEGYRLEGEASGGTLVVADRESLAEWSQALFAELAWRVEARGPEDLRLWEEAARARFPGTDPTRSRALLLAEQGARYGGAALGLGPDWGREPPRALGEEPPISSSLSRREAAREQRARRRRARNRPSAPLWEGPDGPLRPLEWWILAHRLLAHADPEPFLLLGSAVEGVADPFALIDVGLRIPGQGVLLPGVWAPEDGLRGMRLLTPGGMDTITPAPDADSAHLRMQLALVDGGLSGRLEGRWDGVRGAARVQRLRSDSATFRLLQAPLLHFQPEYQEELDQLLAREVSGLPLSDGSARAASDTRLVLSGGVEQTGHFACHDGLLAVQLPLDTLLGPRLAWLAQAMEPALGIEERELWLGEDHLAIEIETPEGMEPRAFPAPVSVEQGPLQLSAGWERGDTGPVLSLTLAARAWLEADDRGSVEALGETLLALRALVRRPLHFEGDCSALPDPVSARAGADPTDDGPLIPEEW